MSQISKTTKAFRSSLKSFPANRKLVSYLQKRLKSTEKQLRMAITKNAQLHEKLKDAELKVEETEKNCKRMMSDSKDQCDMRLEENLEECGDMVRGLKKECQRIINKTTEQFNEMLEYERKAKDWFRDRIEELEKQQSEPEPAISVSIPQPECPICHVGFSEHPDRIPRVLGCGHSLCTLCCYKITEETEIKCPFDRIITEFDGCAVISLPKNFTVLETLTS